MNHATTKRKPKPCKLDHIANCAVSLDLAAAGVYHAHAHARARICTDTRKNETLRFAKLTKCLGLRNETLRFAKLTKCLGLRN